MISIILELIHYELLRMEPIIEQIDIQWVFDLLQSSLNRNAENKMNGNAGAKFDFRK